MNKSVFRAKPWCFFLNFLPNKVVTLKDKDSLWTASNLKDKTKTRQLHLYEWSKKWLNKSLSSAKTILSIRSISRNIQGEGWIPQSISHKLSDPRASSKICWSILKLFHDGKKSTNFPPLLINNKLDSDFKTNANYFNSFFASKFTPC